ncbi:Flp family type IVb pilin [Microvirga sp. ACRRW]|uniref:Flp family type IVb pilin n=1 Tax=Microvirga sp. ACRRW TaxID=2918205 RepID=UPI001EF4484B|nr:Flp family type IVb pilin [Microvirga sp. ACRRW]MCG7391503.1 Flp family type IVb pilin [Microvirga sp. ACRRW]
MKSLLKRFSKNESGATAIEYGLIAALIAVTIIGMVTLAGGELKDTFDTVQQKLAAANTAAGTGTTTPP